MVSDGREQVRLDPCRGFGLMLRLEARNRTMGPFVGHRPAKVSTSYVERQNLTMRMGIRRFTKLTNGFSKKIENHTAAVALHFMHYNFARAHKTLASPSPRTRRWPQASPGTCA